MTRRQLTGTALTFLALAGYLAIAFAAGWVPREEPCVKTPYQPHERGGECYEWKP